MTHAAADEPNITFRRGTLDDLEAILEIWALGIGAATGDPKAKEQTERARAIFADRLKTQTDSFGFWIAERQGAVVGWQSLLPMRNAPLRVHAEAESSIYIRPGLRGARLGSRLMEYVLENAKRTELEVIYAVVLKSNTAGLSILNSTWVCLGDLPVPPKASHLSEAQLWVYPVPIT